jgi:hypothetical protein
LQRKENGTAAALPGDLVVRRIRRAGWARDEFGVFSARRKSKLRGADAVFVSDRGARSANRSTRAMEEASAHSASVVPVVTPVRTPFGGLRQLSRWLYTQNPFYLLSAWLVFFGLRWSYGAGAKLESSAALFTGLLSYTLLLALASIVVVRFARVWDDARSMLLLVVLMFLGTSVALDETLVRQTNLGRVYYLVACGLAAASSELVLRTIRLRLPGWYRVSFHALMALFFWYPVLLTPWFANGADPRLPWLLFAFAPCAAVCFALLFPAVWRGADYVRGNGSPWPWPLYPWSLFAILALCVAGRAFYLCFSFHFVARGATIFGPYFLLPLLWCLSVLWLTGAARAGRRLIAEALLLAPILWGILAVIHRSDPVYMAFLRETVETFGASPLFINLLAALGYFLYARWLRVACADFFLLLTLGACSLVAPRSLYLGEVTYLQTWPFAVGALWFAWRAWRGRDDWYACLAGALALIALDRQLAVSAPAWHWTVTCHALLVAVLAFGYLGRGDFADWFRRQAGPVLFLVALLAFWYGDSPLTVFAWWGDAVYVAMLVVAALAYAWLTRLRVYALTSAAMLTAAGAMGVWPWYSEARLASPGLDYVLVGLASLALGLAVSFRKAGYLTNLRRLLRPEPAD